MDLSELTGDLSHSDSIPQSAYGCQPPLGQGGLAVAEGFDIP